MLQNTERGQAVRRLKQWNAAEEYVTNPCVGLCMWNLHPQRPRICLADARGLLRAANVTVHSSHSYPIISWGALYHILRAYLLITLLLLGKDTWKAKTSREVLRYPVISHIHFDPVGRIPFTSSVPLIQNRWACFSRKGGMLEICLLP